MKNIFLIDRTAFFKEKIKFHEAYYLNKIVSISEANEKCIKTNIYQMRNMTINNPKFPLFILYSPMYISFSNFQFSYKSRYIFTSLFIGTLNDKASRRKTRLQINFRPRRSLCDQDRSRTWRETLFHGVSSRCERERKEARERRQLIGGSSNYFLRTNRVFLL